MDELCPFCGDIIYIKDDGWGKFPFSPGCNNALCPVFSTQYATKAEAAAAWNTRAPTLSEWEQNVLAAARVYREAHEYVVAHDFVRGERKAQKARQAFTIAALQPEEPTP